MRLEYQITKQDFLAARKYTSAGWPQFALVLAEFFYVMPLPAFARNWAHHHGALADGLALALFLAAVLLWVQHANRVYDQASELHGPLWIKADEDGIAVPGAAYPWTEIRKAVDGKKLFLLFPKRHPPILVPKHDVPPEQTARLSALLLAAGVRNYFSIVGGSWLA